MLTYLLCVGLGRRYLRCLRSAPAVCGLEEVGREGGGEGRGGEGVSVKCSVCWLKSAKEVASVAETSSASGPRVFEGEKLQL